MTFPTVIETPLPLEPVTRDPFADGPPAGVPEPAGDAPVRRPAGTTQDR